MELISKKFKNILNNYFKKTTIFFFIEKNSSLVFSLISFYIITQALNFENIAIYAYVVSITTIAGTVCNFGTNGLLIKILTESKCKVSPIINTFKLRLIISILLSIILIIFFYENVNFYYILLSLLILPARSLEVIDQKYIHDRNFEKVTKITLYVGLLFLLFRFFGFYLDVDVSYYILLLSLQIISNKILLFKGLSIKILELDLNFCITLIKRSYMIFIGSVLGTIFLKYPVIYLYEMGEDELTTGFFIIFQIVMYSSLFAGAISAHYYKEVLSDYSIHLVKKYRKLMFCVGIFCAFTFLLSYKIPIYIFKLDFYQADRMILIISPMIFLLFAREYYSKMILINEQQKISVESNFLKLLILLVLLKINLFSLYVNIIFSLVISQMIEIFYIRWRLKQ